jgi:hypothetical protein
VLLRPGQQANSKSSSSQGSLRAVTQVLIWQLLGSSHSIFSPSLSRCSHWQQLQHPQQQQQQQQQQGQQQLVPSSSSR